MKERFLKKLKLNALGVFVGYEESNLDYREEVVRTLNPHLTSTEMLINGCLGLTGEAGEVADMVKKHLFQGHDISLDKFLKELGDVRWYLEVLAHWAGCTMEEIEEINIHKLRSRYPNGFSHQASKERKDTAPVPKVLHHPSEE
jgi:NTP pyrophosphatase (non-canonical NTP hydrolase)